MSSIARRGESRSKAPIRIALLAVTLAAAAAVPTTILGGVDALSMMGLGAGLGLAIVLGGYYCVQLAFRGPDRYAVKLVVGGFVVRLGLLFAALAVLAAATDIPVSRFVLWLVAFYFVLVLAEAWILAREQMLGPREENPR